MTLAIAAIMAALAVPDLTRYYSKREFYSQKDELCACLNRVRERAVEQGIPWRVTFSPADGSWFCYGDRNNNDSFDRGEEAMAPYHLERGITFSTHAHSGPHGTAVPADGISLTGDRISFSPMGTCNAGTIFLSCRNRDLALRIYPASGALQAYEYGTAWEEIR